MFLSQKLAQEIIFDKVNTLVQFTSYSDHLALREIYKKINLPHPFWFKEHDRRSVTLCLQSPASMATFEIEGILTDLSNYFSGLIDILVVSTASLDLTTDFQTGLKQTSHNLSTNTILPTTDYSTDMYWHRCLEAVGIVAFITPDLDSPYTYTFEQKSEQKSQKIIQKYTQLPLEEINKRARETENEWSELGTIGQLHALSTQLLMYKKTSPLFPVYQEKKPDNEFKEYLAVQPNLHILA